MSFDQPSSSESAGRRVGQFSLLTLILLTTTIGVLLPLVLLPGQCQQARLEIAELWPLYSVVLQDPWRQVSAARRNVAGSQGIAWQIYVPSDENLQLAWTTKRPAPSPEALPATAAAPLPPGEHTLVIRYLQQADGTWLIETLVDDQVLLQDQQPAAWNPQLGSYTPEGPSWATPATRPFESIEMDPQSLPLYLHDEIFYTPDPGIGGGKSSRNSQTGLRVWIESAQP